MTTTLRAACLLLVALSACGPKVPRDALRMHPQALQQRQLSTRVYETHDETEILVAVAGLLQDLGFMLDDSETGLGLIVASKDRSATEGGQVAGKVSLALLGANVSIDQVQHLKASVVTRPTPRGIAVRVTFQRIVWNDMGQISKRERLHDARLYQDFFERLSKAVFLEAHDL
jgi:hypothetical protein